MIRKESTSLRDAGAEQSNPGTGEEKTVFGRQTPHQEASQATDSRVLREGTVRSRAVPTRPRFGTKSQDGGKDHGCGGWLAGKDLLDSNPPASTPNFLS